MDDHLAFACAFTSTAPSMQPVTVAQTQEEAKNYWNSFWKEGAAVDFSACTDPRAKELERRVYLAIFACYSERRYYSSARDGAYL